MAGVIPAIFRIQYFAVSGVYRAQWFGQSASGDVDLSWLQEFGAGRLAPASRLNSIAVHGADYISSASSTPR